MLAKVYIKPKDEVLDPQGKTVKESLETMGYEAVTNLRMGKYMEIELEDNLDRDEADRKVEEMCDKLLANPIIESYSFEIE